MTELPEEAVTEALASAEVALRLDGERMRAKGMSTALNEASLAMVQAAMRAATQPTADRSHWEEVMQADTYQAMHQHAAELGYPSILEALEDLERLKTALPEEEVMRRAQLPETLEGHWTSAEGRDKASEYVGKQRSELCHGELSDLAIANRVFMASRDDLDLIHWQEAAKQRIRWLSAQLALALSTHLPPKPKVDEDAEDEDEEIRPVPDPNSVAGLRHKLRMIISHASGGHLSKRKDTDRSVNDICVEISRHHNRIWEHAQEVAARLEDGQNG